MQSYIFPHPVPHFAVEAWAPVCFNHYHLLVFSSRTMSRKISTAEHPIGALINIAFIECKAMRSWNLEHFRGPARLASSYFLLCERVHFNCIVIWREEVSFIGHFDDFVSNGIKIGNGLNGSVIEESEVINVHSISLFRDALSVSYLSASPRLERGNESLNVSIQHLEGLKSLIRQSFHFLWDEIAEIAISKDVPETS